MSAAMQSGSTRKIRVRPTGRGECDCCGLSAPRAELLPWTRRQQCRELAVQDPARRPGRRPEEEWVTGVYRNYYVTNHFQVCNACFDYLLDGGEFASALRHRLKIGFLILAFVVVVTIVMLPDLLPVLKSALWLEKGE
jgi:hypothetical protein